jgi:8-amino-7-oxononanoate synthase
MDLLDKIRVLAVRAMELGFSIDDAPVGIGYPGDTVIDEILGAGEVVIGGKRTLMFGSNNYLGLTLHPQVMAAAQEAITRYGTATTGSRIANGTLRLHRELEHDFAELFEKRRGMIFTTGHQANLSVIAGLCGAGDVVLIDAESHASVYDGARLSGAELLWFRHNSPENLEQKLKRLPAGERNRLVVVEGLYSIHGDVSPLAEIVDVCKRYGAYLLVDEAHSFGLYGARGRGWAEAQGVLEDVDFLVGTFSKALAGIGGFCVSDHPELQGLHFTARAYLFTASGPPASLAGVQAALRLMTRDSSFRDRLWSNTRRFRAGLVRLGFTISACESPLVAVHMGTERTTIQFWQSLIEHGVYTNVVLPPAVRKDQCLLRASCSAMHSDADVDTALERFSIVGQETGVLAAASR